MKKKSGNAIDGISSDLFRKKLCSIRHATPCATAKTLTTGPASRRSDHAASAIATTAIAAAIPNPSASASTSQPTTIRLRTPSIR